jgi:nucleoside-diphosphate-sugar epimerase
LSKTKFEQNIIKFSPEVVIHLAAYSTASDSYEDMECLINANILFLGKVLDALKSTNLKCFIYTGSSTEYHLGDGVINPSYLYSATKTAGRSILDYYADVYDFKSIFITPYTVYGGITAQKKIIDILFDSLDSDKPINITPGEQTLDFIHVLDLADLYCKVINNISTIPNKTNFHAGNGEGHTLRQLAALLEKASRKKTNLNWGGISYRKKDTMYSVANTNQQRELLNWHPSIDLTKGIKMYLEIKDKIAG